MMNIAMRSVCAQGTSSTGPRKPMALTKSHAGPNTRSDLPSRSNRNREDTECSDAAGFP